MPCRTEIDPIMIKDLLPRIVLIDVKEGEGYKLRLVGTAIAEVLGENITGKSITDFPGTSKIAERYDWLVSEKKGYYSEVDFPWANLGALKDGINHFSVLALPLSSDGENVNIIISTTYYY